MILKTKVSKNNKK